MILRRKAGARRISLILLVVTVHDGYGFHCPRLSRRVSFCLLDDRVYYSGVSCWIQLSLFGTRDMDFFVKFREYSTILSDTFFSRGFPILCCRGEGETLDPDRIEKVRHPSGMKNESRHRYRWKETDIWEFSHWMNRSSRLVRRVAWETVSVVVLVIDAGEVLVILVLETLLHPTQNRCILHFRSNPPRQCDGACWCPFHSWFHKPPHGYHLDFFRVSGVCEFTRRGFLPRCYYPGNITVDTKRLYRIVRVTAILGVDDFSQLPVEMTIRPSQFLIMDWLRIASSGT